jgi:hypothetical protein
MTWVRVHPDLANWPGGDAPPRFRICSDAGGDVVMELAWDPQALMAPATYPDPLRYYTTALDFAAATTDDDGTARQVSVAAQSISHAPGTTTWSPAPDLWAAYVQEARKTLHLPATTTFSGNLYYRARLTAVGSAQATMWPSDDVLNSPDASAAPHLGILALNANAGPSVPDATALAAAGGVEGAPTLWSDAIGWLWSHLPESDSSRISLAATFGHPVFGGAGNAARGELLKLWLFAGPGARMRITELLDRSAPGGQGAAGALVGQGDLRGGRSLLQNLLDLLEITAHPDLIAVVAQEQLLDDVITEILDPNGQLDHGRNGTSSPTSLHDVLLELNAAEYARLQVGLLSTSATATLAGGDQFAVPTGVFPAGRAATASASDVFLVRTNAELAFQAAALAYGAAGRFPALTGDPDADNAAFQSAVFAGLSGTEAAKVLSGVFGVGFSAHQVPWPPQPDSADWSSQQAGLCAQFLAELAAKPGQLIAHLFWGQAPAADAEATHAVLAEHRAGGRVTFRNPQYPGSAAPSFAVAGGTSSLPPRWYEDPLRALESIAESDLTGWIVGYLAPETALI